MRVNMGTPATARVSGLGAATRPHVYKIAPFFTMHRFEQDHPHLSRKSPIFTLPPSIIPPDMTPDSHSVFVCFSKYLGNAEDGAALQPFDPPRHLDG